MDDARIEGFGIGVFSKFVDKQGHFEDGIKLQKVRKLKYIKRLMIIFYSNIKMKQKEKITGWEYEDKKELRISI